MASVKTVSPQPTYLMHSLLFISSFSLGLNVLLNYPRISSRNMGCLALFLAPVPRKKKAPWNNFLYFSKKTICLIFRDEC